MFKCEVCEKGFLLRRKLSLYARDHYRKGFLFLQIFWQHICSQFETHSKLYYIIYTCGLFHCDRIYCVSLNDVTLKLFFHNVANRWFLKNFLTDIVFIFVLVSFPSEAPIRELTFRSGCDLHMWVILL